jgi:Ca2+-binding RTX toxin-like protein
MRKMRLELESLERRDCPSTTTTDVVTKPSTPADPTQADPGTNPQPAAPAAQGTGGAAVLNASALADPHSLVKRDHPATVLRNGGNLTVVGDSRRDNVIILDPVGTQVRVTLNGQQTFYDNVTQITVVGGKGDDDISNNTSLNSLLLGGAGNDTILSGAGNDTIDGGSGRDVMYDLLGTNTITSNDGGADRVFTNAQSTATVGANDRLVTFFTPNRTPGSGTVSLENGVLYITPSNNGTSVVLNEAGTKIVLTYDFGNGPVTQTFSKRDVQYIAYFGGTGNDLFVNNTRIDEVAYGSAGNDTLVGGMGDFTLMKGSGGNDTLTGRARRNDLSGNAGADTLTSQGGHTTFRTDSADSVGARPGDLIVAS